MEVVRVCFVFVLILCNNCIAGKPIFTRGIMCELFCDDDDITSTSTSTSTTTSSSEEYFDWMIDCSTDCRPRRRRTTTPRPGSQMPFSFVLPPGQPMNVTMQNQGNSWSMYVMPGTASATPPPMASGAAAPAAAAPAGAAPAGAAPAPAGAAPAPAGAPPAAATPAGAAPAGATPAGATTAEPATTVTPPA